MLFTILNRLKPISVRLTLWYSGLFMLSALILFVLSYALLGLSLRHADHESIALELHELAELYHDNGVEGITHHIELHRRLPGTQPLFMRLADPQQHIHVLVNPEEGREFHLTPIKKMVGTADIQWVELLARHDRERLEVASLGLADGTLLQVGRSTEDRRRLLTHFRTVSVSVILAVVLLGFGCGTFLTFHALHPIRQLIRTVQSIESGAMDSRVPIYATGDELDELGRLFNAMLNKIAALIQGMRDAVDNVAHDLRTPLTRIRGTAEIALGSELTLKAYREALVDCVEESDRLLAMLNALMDISEAETGTLTLTLEPVDIGALIEDVVDLYREVAEEKALNVSIKVEPDLWVQADRNRLRQVFATLLDNAIKYTPEGGTVDCMAGHEQTRVVMVIEDTGLGITQEELPKIWERLYRGDRSRSQRGLGLGLSLVRAVVHAHRGTVDVSSIPGTRSRFTVILPFTAATTR